MQLQFNKSVIRCLEVALQQVQSTEVTQEYRLPDGMPDIGRVLSTFGQVIIRSKQWQGDTVQMTGGVMMWVLYAPEDGTEARSVDAWIPFQLNWNLDNEKREGPMRMMPILTSADSRSLSARKLMLRAGVSSLVQAMSPMEAEIHTPGEMPEDIQLLRRTYPVTVPVEGGEKSFLIDDEANLPEVGSEVQKLLSVTVSPEVTEKRIMSDKVVFKGVLTVHPVCRYADGEVRSFDISVPFSQLSDLDNAYGADVRVDIRMAVTSLEADLAQQAVLRLKCGLVAQYLLDDRHILELVQDAYSPRRTVELTESTVSLPVILDERTEYIQAEQNLPGQNGRMVEGHFLPAYPRKRRTAGSTDLELSGMFQILTCDEEASLQGAAPRWEGTMQLCSDETCDPLVTVKPIGRVQAITSADDMTLNSQLQVTVHTGKTEALPMVSALELGQLQESDPTRPSVILAKGTGESLWDLAKECNSTISDIRMANDIQGDVTPERMILIPVI